MKNINKILSLFAITALLFTTSCNEDDNTGESEINFTSPTVTLSTPENNVIVHESDLDVDDLASFTVTATIDAPALTDLHIPITQIGGTANSDDYEAGTIIIPSGLTSASTEVVILKTGDVESEETLQIGAGSNIANAVLNPFTFNISIVDDYFNQELNITLDWEGFFDYEDDNTEATYNLCGMDFDFLIYDASFADTGDIQAQTISCPESLNFDPSWADGEYIIVAYLYDNPYLALDADVAVPITVTYDKEYFDTNGTIVVSGITTNTIVGTQTPLVIVTKVGDYYTVSPYN